MKNIIKLIYLATFMIILVISVNLLNTNDTDTKKYEISSTDYTVLGNIHTLRVAWDNVYCVHNVDYYDAGFMFFDENNSAVLKSMDMDNLYNINSQAILKLKKVNVSCKEHYNNSIQVMQLIDVFPIKWFTAQVSSNRLIIEITNPFETALNNITIDHGYGFKKQIISLKPYETKKVEWDTNSFCEESSGNLQLFITSDNFGRRIEKLPLGDVIIHADFDMNICKLW